MTKILAPELTLCCENIIEELMMRKVFDGWAPPLIWGPQVEVLQLFGKSTIKLMFKTRSDAESSFSAEIDIGMANGKKMLSLFLVVVSTYLQPAIAYAMLKFVLKAILWDK